MIVLHVASEVAPWSQTGGLAQVAGALPGALARTGAAEVAVVTPLYRAAREALSATGVPLRESGVEVSVQLGGHPYRGRFWTLDGEVPLHFLDCPPMFDREGLYGGGHGDYGDNARRFAMLSRAALDAAPRLCGAAPDIVHAHDWQTGLIPAYLATTLRDWLHDTRSVLTVHNLAFQGVFAKEELPVVGLDWSLFTPDCAELFDLLSFLKAGLACADAVTTVSPSYAEEIVTPEGGMGLDGFVAHHVARLEGVLNGIDTAEWNPADDDHIATPFTAADPAGKARCREALLREMHLPGEPGDLVVGVVSRFAWQKGIDLVAAVVPLLAELGVRLVVLGSGERPIEDHLAELAAAHPERVAVRLGYDVALAHRIVAGSDAIAVPSRFEPCGLTQMYAMRYGALPIVRSVGGLRDTVADPGDDALARGEGTGFCFDHADAEGLAWAVGRAARLHRDQPAAWRAAMRTAMNADWSWDASARQYLSLYAELVGGA